MRGTAYSEGQWCGPLGWFLRRWPTPSPRPAKCCCLGRNGINRTFVALRSPQITACRKLLLEGQYIMSCFKKYKYQYFKNAQKHMYTNIHIPTSTDRHIYWCFYHRHIHTCKKYMEISSNRQRHNILKIFWRPLDLPRIG